MWKPPKNQTLLNSLESCFENPPKRFYRVLDEELKKALDLRFPDGWTIENLRQGRITRTQVYNSENPYWAFSVDGWPLLKVIFEENDFVFEGL